LNAINRPASDLDATLAALRFSLEDLNRAHAAVEVMERRTAESLSASTVNIFENGLVIAINQDVSRADFFSTDRIDFRRFHRDVSAGETASFVLTPLGSSEARSVRKVKKQPLSNCS
jgi:hypothetical protein